MGTQEKINDVIIVFFAHKKHSRSFVKIKVEPLMSRGLRCESLLRGGYAKLCLPGGGWGAGNSVSSAARYAFNSLFSSRDFRTFALHDLTDLCKERRQHTALY